MVLSLSSVPGLLWRAHSFKRAGATDELSECQAQNRGTYLWVFLEYCIFFTVRAFFFPFTRKEDQGSWQGPCDFCISPSSRSLFSSFLRADHFFPFLLALKVLSCLRQEVSKGLFGITEKLSKLCSFFSRLRSIVPYEVSLTFLTFLFIFQFSFIWRGVNWLTQNVTLHRASQSRTNNESETGPKCLLNSSLSWEVNRAAFVWWIIHSKIAHCCLCVCAFPFCSLKRYDICSCMDCLEMGLTRLKCTRRLVRTCFRVRGQGDEQLQSHWFWNY